LLSRADGIMMTAYYLEKILVIKIIIYEKFLSVPGTNWNPKLVSC